MNPRNEMPFQPETVPELSRYIEYQFTGMREHIDSLTARLDRLDVVTRSEFADAKGRLENEDKEIRAELASYISRQSAMWKWIVTSIVIPMVAIVVSVLALINS
jgi:hypothetical protein